MRVTSLALLLACISCSAGADDAAEAVQQKFNAKYRDFLTQSSQVLLPLPQLDKTEWKKLLETRPLQKLYSEAERFYNNKSYTFNMYRDSQSGDYYLDAKGGFWGMEELVYGPIDASQLQ